ncbi:MAG TPA: hypothetical protein VKZ96_04365 [Thermomicrobiales bacterium]|nr:hypothetical protein [Thermomicrobiales bacterium]
MIGGISGVNVNYGTGPSDLTSCSGRCAQLSAELDMLRRELELALDSARELRAELETARAKLASAIEDLDATSAELTERERQVDTCHALLERAARDLEQTTLDAELLEAIYAEVAP